MPFSRTKLLQKIRAISDSGLSIYNTLDDRPDLFLTIEELEQILTANLVGLSLAGYPLRTRSKVFKSAVCKAIGYPVPKKFMKTKPRFPGQDFDTYVQKADNLQVWNEEISPTRRYVLARPDFDGVVQAVRVVTGEALAKLDKKGTLTKKYQARRRAASFGSKLVSPTDTPEFIKEFSPQDKVANLKTISPISRPRPGEVLSIRSVYRLLLKLVGSVVKDPGYDQERNRGAGLQKVVCEALGLGGYADKGQWPDVLCQALELKLQTSSTIDLGLVSPDGREPAQEVGTRIRHCDVRYAIFYALKETTGTIRLKEIVVSTGADLFEEFDKFGGKVINAKLQIPLSQAYRR